MAKIFLVPVDERYCLIIKKREEDGESNLLRWREVPDLYIEQYEKARDTLKECVAALHNVYQLAIED